MILTKENTQTFYLMLTAFTFFAFISPLSSVFSIVLCALMIVSVILLDDGDIFCFLIFISCFMTCFDIESRFLKMSDLVMAILVLKQLIIAIKCKNKKNIIFICSLLAFAFILFSYSLILNNFHVYKLWQSLGLLLTIASIYLLGKVCIKKLTLTLSFGLIVSASLAILAYGCGISKIPPFLYDDLCGFRYSAYFNYVNAFALYCSLCQACILTLFLTKKLDIKKWLWLSLIITCMGLLTFSKSFISITSLTYLIATIIGFAKSKNKKHYIKLLLIALITVAILIVICHNYIESIIKRFFDTGYEGSLNIITTGRFDIWKAYLKHISKSPLYLLFGCGITANSLILWSDFSRTYTPHNLFISILYRFGIAGIIALICIIVFIIKQHKLNKNVYFYFPLFILLINVMFEDITSSLFTCLPILVASCFIFKNKEC